MAKQGEVVGVPKESEGQVTLTSDQWLWLKDHFGAVCETVVGSASGATL